jgi:hypothetical protein
MTSFIENKNIYNCFEVSNIYYRDIIIQIHWDNIHQNVLVQQAGMWLVLIDMTIREVIHSLGFYDNDIVVTWAKKYNLNVLDLLVSKAHQNTIVISQDNPCCIISDNFESDYIYESFSESSNEREISEIRETRETRIDVSDESDEIDEELNISQRLSSWILSICTKKYKFVTVNKFEN